MNEIIFVIAGTQVESLNWIRKDIQRKGAGRLSDYRYVDSPVDLKGYRNPHGVFIGNWIYRLNIRDILTQLKIASDTINPGIETAINMWVEKYKLK